MNFSFARNYIEKKKVEIRNHLRTGFKNDELKALDFHENGQDIQRIIDNLRELSNYDKSIITNENKISGAIYVEDLSKFEYFVSESMSKILDKH